MEKTKIGDWIKYKRRKYQLLQEAKMEMLEESKEDLKAQLLKAEKAKMERRSRPISEKLAEFGEKMGSNMDFGNNIEEKLGVNKNRNNLNSEGTNSEDIQEKVRRMMQ